MSGRPRGRLFTILFVCLLVFNATVLLCLPFSATIQSKVMEKFHLRFSSFGEWAVWQFVPSMYNFANEILISHRPVTSRALASGKAWAPTQANRFSVNHYPLRYVTFSLTNRRLLRGQLPAYIYLRSRYRQTELISVYLLTSEKGAMMLRRISP